MFEKKYVRILSSPSTQIYALRPLPLFSATCIQLFARGYNKSYLQLHDIISDQKDQFHDFPQCRVYDKSYCQLLFCLNLAKKCI